MRRVRFVHQFANHYAFTDYDGNACFFNSDGSAYNGPTYFGDLGEEIAIHKVENFNFPGIHSRSEMAQKFFELYMKPHREGFWNDARNNYPQYPMPEPGVLSDEQAQTIFELITAKQKEAVEARARGLSHSRIDGSVLGCVEYHLERWAWPGDFAPHYVLKHKCKPTAEFLDFIGYVEQ